MSQIQIHFIVLYVVIAILVFALGIVIGMKNISSNNFSTPSLSPNNSIESVNNIAIEFAEENTSKRIFKNNFNCSGDILVNPIYKYPYFDFDDNCRPDTTNTKCECFVRSEDNNIDYLLHYDEVEKQKYIIRDNKRVYLNK